MDSILSFALEEGFDYDIENEEPVSMWIKEGNVIRPSTNLVIKNNLDPGIYKISLDRQYGIHCKPITISCDELITLNNPVIESLISEISMFWDKKDLYFQNKLIHKRGILLEGFPGTGKTSIITLLCEDLIKRGGIIFKLDGPADLSNYIAFVNDYFRKIENDTPCITIIEDIEKYGDEVAILDLLDGKNSINHHVVIGTTNNSSDIPDTYLRPSRIDLRIEIDLPTEEVRRNFLEFKGVPNEDIEKLVELTDNFSIADLKELYTSVYLLEYDIESSVDKLINPRDKKNYTSRLLKTNKLAI